MASPTQRSQPIAAAGAVASALAMASPATINYQFSTAIPKTGVENQAMPISAIEMAAIDAKIDAKVADVRGDVRLNTAGLDDLKKRFDDLAARMASVPTDLATVKATVLTLPDKDWVSTKLRNSVLTAAALFAMLGGVITWGPKLISMIP